MTKLHKIGIILFSIAIWAVIFAVHGYVNVQTNTGQCCGYEGDPGFLSIFFLIGYGVYYFPALALVIAIEYFVFRFIGARSVFR